MTQGLRFDGCEVIEQLRSGPVTNWYQARQTAVGRTVVIKSLSPNVLPESPFAAPLEREAQLLGRLHHKGVVQLYDFVKHDQRMWLVREFVPGDTLDELLRKKTRLPPMVSLAIATQLAETLAYVHAQGIVHRDLQPNNILVSTSGEVKLSNFFLATERQSPAPPELLETNSGFAEPNYMSPEQVLGEAPDPRGDLFSLGILLYEMLGGVRPFDAPDHRSTSQRIRHDPPAALNPELNLPLALERLLLRALQKIPTDRYSDATEMGVSLRQVLKGFTENVNLAELVKSELYGETRNTDTNKPLPNSDDSEREKRPLLRALLVYTSAFLLLAIGMTALQLTFGHAERSRPTKRANLELAPKEAAFLRAVVRPWAHVFIDGQQVETTPFSHPLPLAPGAHYIRFEHPNAAPVRREIQVSSGQNVLLDIEMPIRLPKRRTDLLALPNGKPDAGSDSP